MTNCKYCGKPFEPVHNGTLYCSKACVEAVKRENRAKYNAEYKAQKKAEAYMAKYGGLNKKLAEAERQGKTYAEMQMAETIELYGRVRI